MRYVLNQQLKRLFAVAVMVGYSYLQLHRIHDMSKFDWETVVAVIVIGVIAIVVTTSKIRIASAHAEHHKREGNKHHVTTDY